MASEREDYLLRLIEDLKIFVSRAVNMRDQGQLGQAVQAVVAAQERLFARPASEIAAFGIDEQLRQLQLDETPETGRNKCLAYASILEEGGNVFLARGRDDLASSAFHLALHVTATIALTHPGSAAGLRPVIARLRSRVAEDKIQPPTRERLDQLG